MRILKRSIQNNLGFIFMRVEEEDDLWYLYNLI